MPTIRVNDIDVHDVEAGSGVGEDDILVPPRFSQELAAGIPGATLEVVPATGHG
jgi:hypothetical protein